MPSLPRGSSSGPRNEGAIADEAPEVYKPSAEVVRVVDAAGISRLVARFAPLGVIKG